MDATEKWWTRKESNLQCREAPVLQTGWATFCPRVHVEEGDGIEPFCTRVQTAVFRTV